MIRAVVLCFGLLLATAGQAASPRALTTLQGPNVFLRDLFDDAGTNAAALLGPGPDPGGRIVVEAAQLDAIARHYGVAWRSGSRADRVVLEWPGRPLRLDEATEVLRAALLSAGIGADCDIDLPGFAPPLVPAGIPVAPTVSQLEINRETGRFTALLTIADDTPRGIDVRVGGQIVAMVETPVARTNLPADTILRSADLHMARVRAGTPGQDLPKSVEEVVGMQIRRPIGAGQYLRPVDLVRPPLVRKGASVRIALETAGLSVTGSAVAMDSGAEGETIRVQNITSRALVYARVIGPDQVRVTAAAPRPSQTAQAGYPQ